MAAATGCEKDPDEAAIAALIEHVRVSIENKAFDEALRKVGDDYVDNLQQRKPSIRPRLERTFGSYDSLDVQVKFDDIDLDGLKAKVPLRIWIEGTRRGKTERIFGHPARAARVDITLLKRNGAWAITGATVYLRRGLF